MATIHNYVYDNTCMADDPSAVQSMDPTGDHSVVQSMDPTGDHSVYHSVYHSGDLSAVHSAVQSMDPTGNLIGDLSGDNSVVQSMDPTGVQSMDPTGDKLRFTIFDESFIAINIPNSAFWKKYIDNERTFRSDVVGMSIIMRLRRFPLRVDIMEKIMQLAVDATDYTISKAAAMNTCATVDTIITGESIPEKEIRKWAACAVIISHKYYDDCAFDTDYGTYYDILCRRNIAHTLSRELSLANALCWDIETITPYHYVANHNTDHPDDFISSYFVELFQLTTYMYKLSPANIAALCLQFAFMIRVLLGIEDPIDNSIIRSIKQPVDNLTTIAFTFPHSRLNLMIIYANLYEAHALRIFPRCSIPEPEDLFFTCYD